MRPIHSRTPRFSILGLLLSLVLGFVPSDEAQAQRRTTRGKSSKAIDRNAALENALRKRTTKIQAKYCRDLERTISWAAGQGLKKEAGELVRTIRSIDPEYRKLDSLEAKVEKAEAEADAEKLGKAQKSLEKRLKTANKKQGAELVKLAGACMKVGLFTKSFDMVREVIRINRESWINSP